MTSLARLARLLERHVPPFVLRGVEEGRPALWVEGDIEVEGRPRSELFFAGFREGRGGVVMDYFPVYVEPRLRDELDPDLLGRLRGKSCFHLGDGEDLEHALAGALEHGRALYRERGWIDDGGGYVAPTARP